MIRQLLLPGLPSEFAARLTRWWQRLRLRSGVDPLTLAEPASDAGEDRGHDAQAYQHRPAVHSSSYDEAEAAGPLGWSTDAPPRKVEGSKESRDTVGDGGGYSFVSVPNSHGLSLFSATTADGSRAVVLFDDPLAAEAFVYIEELGEGWEVVEHPPSGTAILLEACTLAGVEYVALNPPSRAITTRWDLRLMPIASFVVSLANAEEGA